MSKNIKYKDECRSGRDYGEYCQEKGRQVKKVGSFLEITTPKGTVHVQDSNRTMPKPERNYIYALLAAIGIAGVSGACGLLNYLSSRGWF